MTNDIYILAAKQISVQQPLCDSWIDAPERYTEQYVRSIEPDYKQYFSPNAVRRLGKILKRVLLTSQQVMAETGISKPDAIITGTGLGCIENTELFLDALVREGEEFLKPTYFMQSTHNTISSLIAIDSRCQGYNCTYTHKGISFETALLDAFIQLRSGRIETALVGAHDEMTPNYFLLLKRIGYLGHARNGFSGETALSMMLSTQQNENALCKVRGMEICYRPNKEELKRSLEAMLENCNCRLEDIDAIMTGYNGEPTNDGVYVENCRLLFPDKKIIQYKHIFGESYTASGLGVYASAVLLSRNRIPAHFFVNAQKEDLVGIKNILFYNQFENKNHSFILLSSCGD